MLVESQNSVLTAVIWLLREALFNVEGGYAHRKYCDTCAKGIKIRS